MFERPLDSKCAIAQYFKKSGNVADKQQNRMTPGHEEHSDGDFSDGAMFQGMVRRMRRMDVLHDMAFVVEGEKYPAHRVVMASASPVLESLLMNGMKETKENEIVLKELSGSTWDAAMYFIYTGKLNLVDIQDGVRMLECSKRFQMEYLEEDVVDFLQSLLDATNCWKLLKVGDHFQTPCLIDSALGVSGILSNFTPLSFADELGHLSPSLAEKLFSKRDMYLHSEFDIVVGMFLWILKQHEIKVFTEKLDSAVPADTEESTAIYPNSCTEAADRMVYFLFDEANLRRESILGLNNSARCQSVDDILRHVKVEKLNEIELTAASILFQGERFADFRSRCSAERSRLPPAENERTPGKYRPLHRREIQEFTFNHLVVEGNSESSWFKDSTGKYQWRLKSARNEDNVSVFIETMYDDEDSQYHDETVTFQISVRRDEDMQPCLVCAPMVKEISWFVRQISKWTSIPQHVTHESGGDLQVSVTLYWFGSTVGVQRPQIVHWHSL